MDRTRNNLIEELIRVGRLIDPAPSTGQQEDETAGELSENSQQSNIDDRSLVMDLEGVPIVDDVVDQPFATKDMFVDPVDNHASRLARPFDGQQPAVNTSALNDSPISVRTDPVSAELQEQLSQETTGVEFPVTELARELVTLIEHHVSQRSGEQLDDTFRDELTQAVITKLEGWLNYN